MDPFLLFMFRVCQAVMAVCSLQPCGHLLGKANLLAHLNVMLSCVCHFFVVSCFSCGT